jgi:hypothetical protein
MLENEVTLSEAIRNLRSELSLAMEEGSGAQIRFQPSMVEVELSIKFVKEGSVGADVKLFSLVRLSGQGKAGVEDTHRIKLSLLPVDASGHPIQLAGTE